MHELWRGECTNVDCDVVYDHDAGSDVDRHPPMYGMRGSIRDDPDDENEEEDRVVWESPELAFGGDENDGYESSFIDDDEHRARPRTTWSDEEDGGAHPVVEDDADDFIPGPARRWSRGRQETIIVSSEEDEDEEPGLSKRVHRGRTRRILDEEDEEQEEQEVEEDVHSVHEEFVSSHLPCMARQIIIVMNFLVT